VLRFKIWGKPLISAFFMAVIMYFGIELGRFTFFLIGTAFYVNMIFLWNVFTSSDLNLLRDIRF
jgi:hypothetical protein